MNVDYKQKIKRNSMSDKFLFEQFTNLSEFVKFEIFCYSCESLSPKLLLAIIISIFRWKLLLYEFAAHYIITMKYMSFWKQHSALTRWNGSVKNRLFGKLFSYNFVKLKFFVLHEPLNRLGFEEFRSNNLSMK